MFNLSPFSLTSDRVLSSSAELINFSSSMHNELYYRGISVILYLRIAFGERRSLSNEIKYSSGRTDRGRGTVETDFCIPLCSTGTSVAKSSSTKLLMSCT